MENYYVALTGSKNNAGDYLIKKRAFQLLEWLRPDRKVIDYNAWEEITPEKLEVINKAKALLFLGGPALRKDMFSKIYNIPDVKAIQVPIISFAIGWKSPSGDWADSRSYPLHADTLSLIRKAHQSGFRWSVRDYTSLNSIIAKGVDGGLMTGCAALYVKEFINSSFSPKRLEDIRKVSFSLGVGFRSDPQLDKQQKETILKLKAFFPQAEFTVVFHHGISEIYEKSQGANAQMYKDHKELARWVENNGLKYVDISGSAESLINHYQEADIHIGYRVHAHIFMSSISKLSVLISEDGRGKGLSQVVPGLYFDSFDKFTPKLSRFDRIKNKITGGVTSKYIVYDNLPSEIISNLKYEFENNFPRMSRTRAAIDQLFPAMKGFIMQLP